MSRQLPKTKAWSIIGAGIHTMKSPNQIDRQGHVVQQHGDRILVEWFSWVMGEATYANGDRILVEWFSWVMGEATYATWHTLDEVSAEKWRFFQTVDDAKSYYDANQHKLTGRTP